MKRIRIILLIIFVGLAVVACGGGSDSDGAGSNDNTVSTGDAVAGEAKYNEVCIACHGPAGVGVEGLGKPFVANSFVAANNDADLLRFVKTGRSSTDPANTTGIDMPPRGGNPALTDDQILDIIAYLRTLQ